MIVDTGAYGIMLTQKNFKELDLTIPIASTGTTSTGVGDAEREQWDFIIDEMRLGPIVVQEPKVSVVDDMAGAMGHKEDMGLLGMGFFGGWRYTIDNKDQVLRFFH